MSHLPLRAALIVALFACVATPDQALAQANTAAPLDADEVAVSTGSWYCVRYAEAVAAGAAGAGAAEIVASVNQFALGYVYGVSEAVGKPFPESGANQARILGLLARGCAEDLGRAVRDATLLAGRAMLEDPASAAGSAMAGATGTLSCSHYLDARAAGGDTFDRIGRQLIHNWADGYINARFERAGRGLIPTAKNKALMLDRFSAACSARPGGTVREAARSVAEANLPGK